MKKPIQDLPLFFVNPTSKIMLDKKIIGEGGVARYSAWDKKIRSEYPLSRIIELYGKYRAIELIKLFVASRRRKIFLLYPHAGIRLDRKGFPYELIGYMYVNLIRFASLRNQVIIDVSDLKYEQAIDLEVKYINPKSMRLIEKKLFSSKRIRFIFASESMRRYARQKYGIESNRTWTCINGGNIADVVNSDSKQKNDRKIRFVYSGTLNKGRNIENMIKYFPASEQLELILMGSEGDWINGLIARRNNIKYLGLLPEDEAHKVVSRCDVGLIPYDEHRLYYNIAYPTKLSFYITAGISFLSTPTKEIRRIEEYNIGYIGRIDHWNEMICKMDVDEIEQKKKQADKFREEFSWEHTLVCPWLER